VIRLEPRIEVVARVTMGGSVGDWSAASGLRESFERECGRVLNAPCFIDSVAAGSVVIAFRVVQYASTYTDETPIVDKLRDPAVVSAFETAIEGATGLPVESSLAVVSTSDIKSAGADAPAVVSVVELGPGAIAGILIASLVGATALALVGRSVGRKRGWCAGATM
jgi:hypothetical protein